MSSPRPRTEPGDPDRPRLWSLLAHGLTQYPDAQLQGEDGEVVTFKQLHEQVRKAAYPHSPTPRPPARSISLQAATQRV